MHRNPASGRAMIKTLFTIGPCAVLLLVIFLLLRQLHFSFVCQANLRTLYRAMEMYEMERGALPKLSFFPDNPTEDLDSLRVVLESHGASGTACLCPSGPASLRELGLTYVWNTQLNGRKIHRGGERTWMLMDIQALSPDVPAPHLRRYHVLYSDGQVDRIADPHALLDGL